MIAEELLQPIWISYFSLMFICSLVAIKCYFMVALTFKFSDKIWLFTPFWIFLPKNYFTKIGNQYRWIMVANIIIITIVNIGLLVIVQAE